jgi:signal transduction histidine kinase
LHELLGRLRSALRADLASVWLVDEDAQVLVLRAVDGVPFERIADVRIPLDSERIKLNAPYVDNDLQPPPAGRDDWHAQEWSAIGLPLRAEMGVPLRVEAKAIGVVRVASTRTPFTEEDQRLLQVVADRAAPAIERGRLLETVGESRRRLAVLSQRLVEVQETERREISRELHDEVGQLLTGLLFKIESHGAGAPRVKDEMRVIVNDLIDRVRDLSMNLRPPMLDDLGLLSALTWLIRRFGAQTGVHVRFQHADLDRRFGGQVEITAFRIVQEALTNVARHAGVKQAKVDLWANAVSLGVRIEDEGRGFDVGAALAARSSGLEGMLERSRLAGGRLAIESAPGKGTRLVVELPLDPASVRNQEKG